MKLHEILKHDLSPWTEFLGKSVKLPSIYDKKNLDIGLTSKTSAQTVIVKNTKTKQIVGKRTLFQKDSSSSKVKTPYDDKEYSSINYHEHS
jgi:hypothetical protein